MPSQVSAIGAQRRVGSRAPVGGGNPDVAGTGKHVPLPFLGHDDSNARLAGGGIEDARIEAIDERPEAVGQGDHPGSGSRKKETRMQGPAGHGLGTGYAPDVLMGRSLQPLAKQA